MAPLLCRASKAARFKFESDGADAAVALVVITVSLNLTLPLQTKPWLELWDCFRIEESSWSEEPLEFELVVEFSELLHSRELSAWDGNFLMNFSGRKRKRDLVFLKYREPKPSDGLLPDKR